MSIDILCGFLLILFIGLGYRSGAIAQLVRLGGLLAAFFLAPRLADLVAEDEPILHWGLTALAFTAIYTAVAITGHFILSKDKGPTKRDRLAGAGIGALKAAALAGLLTASLQLLAPELRSVDPEDRLHIQGSLVMSAAQKLEKLLGL